MALIQLSTFPRQMIVLCEQADIREQISVQKEPNHVSGTSTSPHIYLLKSNLNTPHSSRTHLVIQLFRP